MAYVGERVRFVLTRAGVREIALIAVIYGLYMASRLLASNDFGDAMHRAKEILRFERTTGLDWESALNDLFLRHEWLGLFGSYWYSTTHYLVTALVLVWLWRRSRTDYVTLRRALMVATMLGLAMYLLLPTAPPRFVEGYVDVLRLHSDNGWWGADASAPRGLGHLTNELAAFPSLHAGWSLWVALVVYQVARSRWLHVIGWAYPAITALVIVGTGNHWLVDAIVGWVVVLVGCVAVAPFVPIVEASFLAATPQPRSLHAPRPLGGPLPSADGAVVRGVDPGTSG